MSIRNTEEDAIYCGRNHGATTSITYLDPRSTLPTATISASTMWIISMSSHAKCLLLVVMVVALYGSTARADSKTYVSNEASLTIVATTSYSFGHSEFVDRYIAPGTYESDQYNGFVASVQIEIWVAGATDHQFIDVGSDRSIVAYDNEALGSGYIDIFLAKFGTLIQKDGDALCTITV